MSIKNLPGGERCLPPPRLRTETDPVSETLFYLERRTMDKVQKPNNPECYTPSSEPFRIYLFRHLSAGTDKK
jgi:hypothetical protein